MILTAFLMLMAGSGFGCRGRIGKLLILRFTPRGLRRLRLEMTRSSRISFSTRSWTALLSQGGIALNDLERRVEGQLNSCGCKRDDPRIQGQG